MQVIGLLYGLTSVHVKFANLNGVLSLRFSPPPVLLGHHSTANAGDHLGSKYLTSMDQ